MTDYRIPWKVLAVFFASFGFLSSASAEDAFATRIGPLLTKHCVDCHGPDRKEGELRLDQLAGFKTEDRHLWTHIYTRIAAGEMPPKNRAAIAAEDKKAILDWIATQHRSTKGANTRRLNRRELSASLRDVTGLSIDYAHAMPGDGTVAGFDTGIDGLQDTADSVALWMRISRRAVDAIRFLDPPSDKRFAGNFRGAKDPRKIFDTWKNDGAGGKASGIGRPGVGLLIEPRSVGDRESFNVSVPVSPNKQGVLRLSLEVSVLRPMEGLPNPILWIEVSGREIDYHELTMPAGQSKKLEYLIQLDDLAIQSKGASIHLRNKIEIPYKVEGFENEEKPNPKEPVPGGIGLFRPTFDRKTLPPEKQPAPYVIIQNIEIEPIYTAAWPPASWKADLGKIEDNTESAHKLLKLWTERAWRRPASDLELQSFQKLYAKLRSTGSSFDDALRGAFQSVLLSGQFRYLESPNHKNTTIGDYAIASRLSFMLVGEPPDAELRKLAGDGKLRDTKVLEQQVDRLLTDPRSLAFVKPFVSQWLELEQPITIVQDHIQKQDFRFARYLKASMKEETQHYVAKMIRDNRPARELFTSDWTMMNDILAIHYGYPAIEGGQLQPVKLRADDPRGGGILGHAGIQSMLCWMGDNWVIYRGAWTMRHILDRPPPPPPLEVPELSPSSGANRGKTFKQLLKQHQEDRRCAVCHREMDPVGFAFQNFDLSGRWRNEEFEIYKRDELDGRIAWRGTGKPRAVDALGQLPRGEEFKTFGEFKSLLAKHYQRDLVRGILKNLMIYSTGRKPDVDDMLTIGKILDDFEPHNYPMRELIKAVLKSPSFYDR